MRTLFFSADRFLESFWRQAGNARQVADDLRTLRVDLFHPRIVGRDGRRGAERVVGEFLHVLELEKWIRIALVADRALETIANVGAAGRARAMGGMNHDAVGQLQKIIAQGVELLLRQLFRLARAEEIGAAGGVNEKRVARQDAPRCFHAIFLRQLVTHVLRRVSRGMPRRDHRVAERKRVAVLYRFSIEAVARPTVVAGEDFGRVHPRAEFAGSAHQVGVDVRFKDVRDREIIFPRHLEVFVDVRRRIENRRHSGAVVSHEVGELRDAVSLYAFENK